MKKLFFLLMISGTVLAQQQGPKGVRYNEPVQFYQKTAYEDGTANETTAFISLGSADNIAVFGSNNDSITAPVRYRLRSKNVGGASGYTVTGAWTIVDTLGQDGGGNLDTSGAQLLGTIALATLLGYDEIQFYIDYIAGTAIDDSNSGAEGTNTVRLFYYFKKGDAVIAK